MKFLMFLLLFLALPQQEADRREADPEVEQLVEQISESGQVLLIAADPGERVESNVRIAPGDPPLLAFRYFEGEAKHRFGELDLVMDDAGH